MKKVIYIFLSVCFLMSCDDDFDIADQGFDLEELPESISFDGGGDGVDASQNDDEGEGVTVTVEAPNGSLANIEVTYSLGGTATFGTDYTIDGATATGGSLTIIDDPSDVVNFDNGSFDIDFLFDGDTTEGAETIIITLESANRNGEQIAVGRGGTDFGKSTTITINDVLQTISLTTRNPAFPSVINTIEGNASDTLELYVDLVYPAITDVNYDLVIETDSTSLIEGTDFVFDTEESTPGSLQISAGESSSTVRVILLDDTMITATPGLMDSLSFLITNLSSTSGVKIADSAVQINVGDEVKRLGFSTAPGDTLVVDNAQTFQYRVSLTDTVRNLPSLASAEVVITYSVDAGTAVEGVDFNDLGGGTITIPQGLNSADIPIQVLRTGQMPSPIISISLTDFTSSDAEILSGFSESDTVSVEIQ